MTEYNDDTDGTTTNNDIPEEVRYAVFSRDNWRCRRCGERDLRQLTQHHIIYRSAGGPDTEENLITLCWRDHRRIHDGELLVKLINGRSFFKKLR